MTDLALDHIVIALPDLAAAAAYERAGLKLTEPRGHAGLGTEARVVFVGDGEAHTYLEFIAVRDRPEAEASGARESLFAALAAGGGAYRLAFRTNDLAAAEARLGTRAGRRYAVTRDDGSAVGDVLPVLPDAGLACDVSLIQYAPGYEARREARRADGLLDHALPLKRLDHLAIVAPDREASIAAWGTLGVGVTGEVRGPGMVITQLRAGDAIVELLSPETPDSPLASRRPGLVSMAAFEVDDLAAVIAGLRGRGFDLPEARPGPLPGTVVTTLPADQLAGLSLQLLQHV